MASRYSLETRDERIERMIRNNPGRHPEMCIAAVDNIWKQKREKIQAEIPERYQQASLSDLGYLKQVVVDAVQEILDGPEKNDTVGLIFSGIPGGGKTHASYAIIRTLMERNPDIIGHITDYSEMFHALKQEFTSDSYDDVGSVWERLTNRKSYHQGLIMIDDVSAQKLTDFEMDRFLAIINQRINWYMPFILTTNVKTDDFKAVFGERIASRLIGNCRIIELEERDARVDKNSATE